MNNNKINVDSSKKYYWWKDKKMLGTILLICTVTMQIFAFLEIPILSTLHSYTIGFLFGYYNPFFYIYVIYFALLMIFKENIKLPKWIKLSKKTYWLLIISIIFISTSTGYYQSKIGWYAIGKKPFQIFEFWFDSFTDNQQVNVLSPKWTNGGIIGVFCFTFSAMIFSGVGSLICSILLILISISLIISGTTFGFYRELIISRKLVLKSKEIKEDKKLDLKKFEISSNTIIEKNNQKDKDKEDFPFEDPFGGN